MITLKKRYPSRYYGFLTNLVKYKEYDNDIFYKAHSDFMNHSDKVPVEDVPIHKISTDQDSVEISSLKSKIKGTDKHNSGGEHPRLIHNYQKDEYYIWDGNHRINAARLLKKKSIKARVVHV